MKKVKPLSEYELDCVWMSYRYCIGRHTIAAAHHAGNIARNTHGRVSKERMNFCASDIRISIADVLRISYDFYVDFTSKDYDPLKLYIEALKKFSIKDDDALQRVDSIHCSRSDNGYEYSIKLRDENDKKTWRSFSGIMDLVPWNNLANYFDTDNYHTVKARNDKTGESTEEECFKTLSFNNYSDITDTKEIWCPVSAYVENPFINTRIQEEYIKEII